MNFDKDLSKKRITFWTKTLAALFAGFIVAPFVFIAVKGLIGGAIALGAAYTIFSIAPWFSLKLANLRLKMIKAEAMKNPVETLQNDFQKRQESLGRFRESIINFDASIRNFADKLGDFKHKFPAEAENFDGKLSKMKQLLKLRKSKYSLAEKGIEAYALEIDKAGAIWEMTVEAAKMNDAAGVDTDEFERQLQVKTALGSIQTNLNLTFSELELSLEEEQQIKAQRFGEPQPTEEEETDKPAKSRTPIKI